MNSALRALTLSLMTVSTIALSSAADARDWGHGGGWDHGRHWGGHRGGGRDVTIIMNSGPRYRPYYPNYYVQPMPVYSAPVYTAPVYPAPVYAPAPVAVAPTSINCVRRNNPAGMIVGGAAGGLLGNTIGKGHGRAAATIGGAILGGILGNNSFGYDDEYCVSQTVSYGQIGQPISYQTPNYSYQVTPTRDWQNEGRYCREYQTVATVGGQYRETYGTACWQPDGSWQIVN